jgi:hypothetical protein
MTPNMLMPLVGLVDPLLAGCSSYECRVTTYPSHELPFPEPGPTVKVAAVRQGLAVGLSFWTVRGLRDAPGCVACMRGERFAEVRSSTCVLKAQSVETWHPPRPSDCEVMRFQAAKVSSRSPDVRRPRQTPRVPTIPPQSARRLD